MIKNFSSSLKICAGIAVIVVSGICSVAFAATTPSTPTSNPTPSTPPVSVSLDNYLSVNTIQDLLVAILNIVIILMIPIIVFFIILAGFKYVTARGNASQVEEATRALTYAIIGGVLVLGAVALSEIIKNVVDQFAA